MIFRYEVIFCLILAFFLISIDSLTAKPAPRFKGELIIDFKDELSINSNEVQALCKKYRLSTHYNSFYSEKTKITLASVEDCKIDELISKLQSEPIVENVEPQYKIQAFKFGQKDYDPLFKYQWNFHTTHVKDAWKKSTGKGVTVAVIDTGVAYENYKQFFQLEDLEKTKFVSPYNFISNTKHANDDNGHGSHVAGTIAQSTFNKKGVAGIAYNAAIMPVKVLERDGNGRISDIAEGIRYAADNGADVINMSLGSTTPSKILEDACKYAAKKNVVIVCASGNDSSTVPNYPAAYSCCISVSATNSENKLAFYTNRNKHIALAAPGGDLTVDRNRDGYMDGILQNTFRPNTPTKDEYILLQGTSMAAPHVAGTAALLKSLGVSSPREIREILTKSARQVSKEAGYGAGLLDTSAAVSMATNREPVRANFNWMFLLLFTIIGITLLAKYRNSRFIRSKFVIIGALFGSLGIGLVLLYLQSIQNYFIFMPQWLKTLSYVTLKSAIPYVVLLLLSLPFKKFKQFTTGLNLGVASALIASSFLGEIASAGFGFTVAILQIWLIVNAIILFIVTSATIDDY